jgi:hypothetical protein
MLKLVNAYRLFGHDVMIKTVEGGLLTPWAPVKELIIEPASIGHTITREYGSIVWESCARQGRSYTLPNLVRGGPKRSMSLHIMQPNIFIRQYRARTVTAPTIVKPVRNIEPVTFRIKNSRTAQFIKKTIPGYEGKASDFRVGGRGIAPRNPPPKEDKEVIVDTASPEVDAGTVDISHQVGPGT